MNEWRNYSSGEIYYRHMADDTHSERVGAYWQTESDREAAESVGVSYSTYYRWRKWAGLPGKGKTGPKLRRVN